MLLYDAELSGNCWKVRQLFGHLGIEYDREAVDVLDRSTRGTQLGALNPALRVPTLVLDDGVVLAESDAILLRFAEGTHYLPSDQIERGEVLRWMFFEQANHQPYLAMAWFLVRVLPGEPDATVLGFLHLMGGLALDAMEQHLATGERDFFVGAEYSVADIALFPYVARCEEAGFDLNGRPALQAWLARVAQQPGHVSPVTRTSA